MSNNGFLDEFMQSEGSGGYISQVRVQVGFRVYESGLSPHDSFFPATEASREALESALAQAQERDSGIEYRNRAFRLTIIKDSILNKDMTGLWPAGDRHFDYTHWTAAAKDVLYPSLLDTGFNPERDLNEPFWAHVSFKQDPFQVDRGDDEPDLVPYVVRRFSSREEALAAVGDNAVANNGSGSTVVVDPPDDWDEEAAGAPWTVWVETVQDMVNSELGESYSPVELTQAINTIHEGLNGVVPKGKIREIATSGDNIPF